MTLIADQLEDIFPTNVIGVECLDKMATGLKNKWSATQVRKLHLDIY